jgi:hypothetical protein
MLFPTYAYATHKQWRLLSRQAVVWVKNENLENSSLVLGRIWYVGITCWSEIVQGRVEHPQISGFSRIQPVRSDAAASVERSHVHMLETASANQRHLS